MNFKQDVIKHNSIFLLGLFLYLFIGMALTQYYGKSGLHLLQNTQHNATADIFFKYYTKLGIPAMILVAIYVIIKKYNYKTLGMFASAYVSAMLTNIFVKRTFFEHVHRPTYYFEQRGIDLHLVEGVSSQIPYTFPSGHTADAFLFMLFFSMISSSKYIQLLAIILALLMAHSRVYLSKHFMIDTLGGALLGTAVIIIMYYIFQPLQSGFLNKKILPNK